MVKSVPQRSLLLACGGVCFLIVFITAFFIRRQAQWVESALIFHLETILDTDMLWESVLYQDAVGLKNALEPLVHGVKLVAVCLDINVGEVAKVLCNDVGNGEYLRMSSNFKGVIDLNMGYQHFGTIAYTVADLSSTLFWMAVSLPLSVLFFTLAWWSLSRYLKNTHQACQQCDLRLPPVASPEKERLQNLIGFIEGNKSKFGIFGNGELVYITTKKMGVSFIFQMDPDSCSIAPR